ncbi:MarR family winged helix-turn-helix transcriptional regulator [Parablautia muri]|nr:MarR family transcriptional regulator [Parablautia muri]
MEETRNLSEKMQCTKYDEGTDINKKLIVHMRELSHIMRSLYEGKASQQRILIILDEVKTITQRDLTIRLGIQPGSASEILSKLENAGLIRRTISETDRRTANLSLTDEGRQMALDAARRRFERHEEMFSCLSEREKEELLSLFEKLNADWTNRYGRIMEERRKQRQMHKCEGERGHKHRHGQDHEGDHGRRHDYESEHRHGYEKDHSREHVHEKDYGRRNGHGKHSPETEEITDVEIH